MMEIWHLAIPLAFLAGLVDREKERVWRQILTSVTTTHRKENPAMIRVKQYRKRTVVISAYQTPVAMVIETLEGEMTASPGDWIITGVNGEVYPCKPDIFEKTYYPVKDDEGADDSRVY